MRVAFHTLGCKVNQYETEAMKEQFTAAGHTVVDEEAPADAYVINTCTVTGLADRKSRQIIRRLRARCPQALIAVCGCYAQVAPEALAAMPEVDLIVGTGEKTNMATHVEEVLRQRTMAARTAAASAVPEAATPVYLQPREALTAYTDRGIITSMESRTRACIKVEEGCDRFCAYCVIPYARGPVRSRDPQEIVAEAESLLAAGFRELVLTGINTALYGMEPDFSYPRTADEIAEDVRGVELLIRRLSALPGDFRLRLSSLEPTVIDAAYVRRLLRYDRLCHHLHLSAQSGSDRILRAMGRRYDRSAYLEIVRILRGFDPGYGITTDLMVGFPGETEADFTDTLRLIEEAGFSRVHGFRFSRRPGTAAAAMAEQVSGGVKKARMERLLAAGEASARRYFAGCAARGEVRRVLLEEETGDGTAMLTGYTDTYVKVYVAGDAALCGTFCRVRLLEAYEDGMKGELYDG